MITKKSWDLFKREGMLWWVNRILHVFGWAIVVFENRGKIIEVYPARIRFRGYCEDVESEEFRKITQAMKKNADRLYEEVKEAMK